MTGAAVPLDAIAALFLSVSLLAFGGLNTVLPEIHHQAVEIGRWLTDREFTDLYALTQAAPGPNYLIVSLIGYRA
ncbi:MAG: chromate transporter, partial [Chloroflexi bacterium]|nr:chromate transporter [Chloroflexota bacterium]